MKPLLLAATLLAAAVAAQPAAAAPAPATVDAAARVELHRDHWQRAVTHARRLRDAVRDEAAHRDYADDLPATQFPGSSARRRFQREASLRRAVTPAAAQSAIVSPGERLQDAVASAPAALPAMPADLARLPKPGLSAPRPQGPIPVAQRGAVPTLPTLDQAVDPLMQGQLSDPLRPSAPAVSCAGVKAGAKRALRAGCIAPRGI